MSNNAWWDGGNWAGGSAPGAGDDVLLGNDPSGAGELLVEQDTTALAVRSLWFSGERAYTLGGTGSLVLGSGLADGGRLITVANTGGGSWHREHNIELNLKLDLTAGYTAEIATYVRSGLRLAGDLDLGENHLRIRGGGAVHLAGQLIGAGDLTVATDAGALVLSADNSSTWTGNLELRHGFLVVTANGALGATSGTVTINANGGSGASLAFRPNMLGVGVDYTTAQAITVRGQGFLGPWGSVSNADPDAALNLRPLGAIFNDGGDNHFAGAITLAGDTALGSRDGRLRLSGAINDGGAGHTLTKLGRGLIELDNAGNSWGGITDLVDGVLRVIAPGSLSSTAPVRFSGGTLELGGGDWGGNLGTGAGEISWASGSDGGFSAYGADRTVTLNGGAALAWGVTNDFISPGAALLLGSKYADASIVLTNAINLGDALREVRVTRGVGPASLAQLSGQLSGAGGGLLKTGDGTLWINHTNNDYSGPTEIRAGVLIGNASIPSGATGSNIRFSGGVLGLYGDDFTRSLGTGSNQVRWLSKRSGGFAAYGSDRWVRFGNNSSTIVEYDTAHFVSEKSYLIFGAPDSDATVFFDNPIKLFSLGNNIRVIAGTDPSRSVVVFNQPFSSSTARDLHFWGDGRADITKDNPDLAIDFVGSRGTDLRIRGEARLRGIRRSYPIEAWWGGSITFDNRDTYKDRIRSATSIALKAGAFRLWGRSSGSNTEQEASELRLSLGASEVEVNNYIRDKYTRLDLERLVHTTSYTDNDGKSDPGDYQATINFLSNTDYVAGATTDGAQLRFREKPAHIGGIMPYATVKGTDWARTTTSGGRHYLTAYTGYQVAWGSTVNASANADATLGGSDRSLNSLRLESGRTVDLTGKTLTLYSGGLLAVGATGTKITGSAGSTLTAPTGTPFYAHVYNSAPVGLEISTALNLSGTNGSQPRPAFVKTGTGTLLLSGSTSNTITGETYVNQGTLALGKTGGAIAIGGTIIVGDRAGTDTLRLDRSEQIADTATVILRGGHAKPEYHLMAEGILKFNGAGGLGLHETFAKLLVEGRGVIDFSGGTVGRANYLILDELEVFDYSGANAAYYRESRLFIRNWFEYEDYLLVKKGNANVVASLGRIEFEGYGPAMLRHWNDEYWEVTPNPEPETYGVILGALGFGLVLWRKRQRASRHSRRRQK